MTLADKVFNKKPNKKEGYKKEGSFFEKVFKGDGRGHWGHEGLEGEVGGSSSTGGSSQYGELSVEGLDREEAEDISNKVEKSLLTANLPEGKEGKIRGYDAKVQVGENLSARLEGNEDFKEYAEKFFSTREKAIESLIKNWAATSGDDSAEAVAMQIAVQREFGLSDAGMGHFDDIIYEGRAEFEENGEAYRAFVRAQYEETQEFFAEQGIEEVYGFRGVGFETAEEAEAHLGVDFSTYSLNSNISEIQTQPLSSFSTEFYIAEEFINYYGDTGGVLASKIPVERIMSTPRTGVGCLDEREITVLGGRDEQVAVGVNKIDLEEGEFWEEMEEIHDDI